MSNSTLGEIFYKVIRELGVLTESTATGGSTTTVADTNFRTEANDYWNGGVVMIVYDAGGAGAAPQGEYRRISDFANSGGVITVPTAFTVSPASGDRYAVAKQPPGENANWSEIVIQQVNRALSDLGPVPVTDTTTLTTAADQTEYNLPLAAKQKLLQVWLQQDSSDSDDNQWMRLYEWYVQRSVAGTQDVLVIPQYSSGYALKLVYLADHSELNASTDQLNEYVPIQRVVYPAVRDCFKWMKRATEWNKWDEEIAYWNQRAELAKANYPIDYPKRHPKMMDIKLSFVRSQSDVNKAKL